MTGVIRRPFARLRRRRAEESEHGAVATLIAVLVAGGVLLGIGAIVIDVGQLYIEREELQSGADAASFKIALNCVKTPASCTSASQTPVAVSYAQKNAKDSRAAAQICFNGTGCPAWNTAVTCPTLPTPAAGRSNGSYVEVRTTTVNADNSTLIPPTFAGALAGSNYAGKKVGTCARVNWGTPARARVFAMGISLCDFNRMTSNNTVFYGALGNLLSQAGVYSLIGLPTAVAGSDSAIPQVLPLMAVGVALPTCTLTNLTPRGYVWLGSTDGTPPDANCTIDVQVGDWPRSNVLSGLLFANYCAPVLLASRASKAPVLVPIFDAVQPGLLSLTPAYRIVGFAPFVVTGYGGSLGTLASSISGGLLSAVAGVLCVTSACVYGYFTKTLVTQPSPTFGTGTNFGATVIGRTG